MKKYVLLSIFITAILSTSLVLYAENSLNIEDIIITSTRIPRALSEMMRHISVIERQEIERTPANSLAELLDHVLSVDVLQRGPYGMQADIAIRGSTFEQVLVLIDGMRINDPQTSHYSMEIPLTLDDIERIEVLHGHGSSVYGPDAFGGVINIITKTPQDSSLSGTFKIADYATHAESVSYANTWDKYKHNLSIEHKKSSGYRNGTDFDSITFSSKSMWNYSRSKINLLLGFTDKDFGAYDFYSPGMDFPSFEQTETYFAQAAASYDTQKFILEPSFFFRQHNDIYILDRNRPAWYTNKHKAYSTGGGMQVSHGIGAESRLVIGGELVQDWIDSESLGNHMQPRQALFAEFFISPLSYIDVNAGLRTDFSNWGQELSPTLGIGYRISSWKFRTSIARAFRSPTFTELYYNSPVNKGNSLLKPETSLSYEIGADYIGNETLLASVTLFERDQTNIIDWVGDNATGPWRARNIGKFKLHGVESTLTTSIYAFKTSLSYTWIGTRNTMSYFSKYALRYPEHQASLKFFSPQYRKISSSINFIYTQRHNEKNYVLINSKISKNIHNFEIFAEGTNLLNEEYEENAGVPQPGRWLGIGVSYNSKKD